MFKIRYPAPSLAFPLLLTGEGCSHIEYSPVTLNEAQTRAVRIDPQLRAADWKLNDRTQVRLEVPVSISSWSWTGPSTDYAPKPRN